MSPRRSSARIGFGMTAAARRKKEAGLTFPNRAATDRLHHSAKGGEPATGLLGALQKFRERDRRQRGVVRGKDLRSALGAPYCGPNGARRTGPLEINIGGPGASSTLYSHINWPFREARIDPEFYCAPVARRFSRLRARASIPRPLVHRFSLEQGFPSNSSTGNGGGRGGFVVSKDSPIKSYKYRKGQCDWPRNGNRCSKCHLEVVAKTAGFEGC